MKHTIKYLIAAISVFEATAQNAEQIQARSETADRPDPTAIVQEISKGAEDVNPTAASDTGAQRPVLLKKNGVSSFFGFDSKYFYRQNPLATESSQKQPTGMWTNTFFGGAGLGVYDADYAVVTPYVGAGWTINDYIEGKLGKFNYNSTSAYALLLAQYENGWSLRVGVNYASDRSTDNDTEDYSDISPSVGALKAYSVNENILGIFDAALSTHNTDSVFLPGLGGADAPSKLDNTEAYASYGLVYTMNQFVISPKYKAIYKKYDSGLNDGRKDVIHNLTLKVEREISESIKLTAFGGYTKRNSSGVNTSYDYSSYDAGVGLGLMSRF